MAIRTQELGRENAGFARHLRGNLSRHFLWVTVTWWVLVPLLVEQWLRSQLPGLHGMSSAV